MFSWIQESIELIKLILQGITGVWIGILILTLTTLGLNIAFIEKLSDDPINPKKAYFFTAVEPGRIKAVVRGGKVIRYLMNYPGHKFTKKGHKTEDNFWNVEGPDIEALEIPKIDADKKTDDQEVTNKGKEEKGGSEEDDPEGYLIHPKRFNLFKFVLLFWPQYFWHVFEWYNWTVYRMTGHVFVGIYPFQKLHFYHFTRKMQKIDENDKPIIDKEGLPVLEDRFEPTDHVRARVFVWHVQSQTGETQEGLKIKIRSIANVRVINPQKALFGANRWDTLLTSTILRTLASHIRTMPINRVLTVKLDQKDVAKQETSAKEELATTVQNESNAILRKFGLWIENYQIIDFDAQLSQDEAAALTAEWRSMQQKLAEKIAGEGRGEGRAAEIRKVAAAVGENAEAKRAQELEAQIRQASEAGKSGGVVILGGQQADSSGINAALLAELKKLNQKFNK